MAINKNKNCFVCRSGGQLNGSSRSGSLLITDNSYSWWWLWAATTRNFHRSLNSNHFELAELIDEIYCEGERETSADVISVGNFSREKCNNLQSVAGCQHYVQSDVQWMWNNKEIATNKVVRFTSARLPRATTNCCGLVEQIISFLYDIHFYAYKHSVLNY